MTRVLRFKNNFYFVKNNIDSGKFGHVYEVANIHGIKAVKKTKNNLLINHNELKYLKKCRGSNKIIHLIDYKVTEEYIYLLTKFYKNGDFFNYIEKNENNIEINEIKKIISLLAEPIKELNEKKLVHLDIKPENYLINNFNKNIPNLILSDLGSVHKMPYKIESTRFNVGSKSYCAPEILENKYHKNSDIWSLGMIVYILVIGEMPDTKNYSDLMKILEERRINENIYEMLKYCLKENPYDRYTINDILNHKWKN